MSNNLPTFKDSIYWHILHRLPQNLMSRGAGALAQLRLPKAMMRWVIERFAQLFDINLEEVARPINEFDSLQSFFIRHLKENARDINRNENILVSPCDGAYGQSGIIENGLLLQVKGKTFRLSELLCDDKWAKMLDGGSFATLYLSPRDYHRFHAPYDMHVTEAWHIPGRLWPVNLWAVRNVDELFCVNERVVMKATPSSHSSESLALIAVGATMVGKVKLEFDDGLTTNRPKGRYLRQSYAANRATFNKGQELGRFEFGSTLVIVVPKIFGVLDVQRPGTPIKMGQKIGIMNHATRFQN